MLMQREATTRLENIANVNTLFFCRDKTTHMEKLVKLRHKRQL